MTREGFENTFAVNHIGHALLFHLLLPYLSNTARIIVTASGVHDPVQRSGLPDAVYISAEELAHPTRPESLQYAGRQRYASSKLANVLWTYALARRISNLPSTDRRKNLTVAAFDPGLMPGTGLAREASVGIRFIATFVLPPLIPILRKHYHHNVHTPKDSGVNLAWLAVEADLRDRYAAYFEGRKDINSSEDSHDMEKQNDVWSWTINSLAISEEEAVDFDFQQFI
jgi:NAD(P)-dependent dehydrogenase (short-subunit alcohol dehydrogenase family)